MKRDPGVGDRREDTASGRGMPAAPLAFPNADGPGRSLVASGPSELAPAALAARSWALAPALICALCAVAAFSIALHDAFGLRAVDEAISADRQERAAAALQAIETQWRMEHDGSMEQPMRDLAAALGLDLQISDAHGVLFSSTTATSGCFAHEQVARLLERRPSAWQAQSADGEGTCVARTASIGGRRVVLLARPADAAVPAGLPAARRQLGWIAALTLAVAALAGLLLARRLARPIRVLSGRAADLAVRYTGRAVDSRGNEMQYLATAFEAMTGALLAQFERLRGLQLDELQNSLELQRRYALMRLLRSLSTAALECEHHEQVLEHAVEELGAYLDWPIGRVLFVGAPGERRTGPGRSVWFVAQPERFAPFMSASESLDAERDADDLIGRAGATAMPHWAADLGRLQGWRRGEAAVQCGLQSGFVIPIAADGSIHAFIEFFSDHRVEASAEMIELIEAIHTELWQAGQCRRNRLWGAAAARPEAANQMPQLDAVGAAGR